LGWPHNEPSLSLSLPSNQFLQHYPDTPERNTLTGAVLAMRRSYHRVNLDL